MDVVEYETVWDLLRQPYETLLACLRMPLPEELRERVHGELASRDRTMHHQWLQACGKDVS